LRAEKSRIKQDEFAARHCMRCGYTEVREKKNFALST
jgi:predicted nucleic-acid-binding Zn-ribbon protein